MKTCLLTGGGSKFGQRLTQQLIDRDYHVHLITSTPVTWADHGNVTVVPVNWKTLDLKDLKSLLPACSTLDLIFFNHNASSLSQLKFCPGTIQNPKDWQQSYFVASQLPFYLIHALKNKICPDTKIGWMLSKLITDPTTDQVVFADYIGNKFTNACIMKSFSQNYPACFFGIHPDGGVNDTAKDNTKAQNIIELITSSSVVELHGKILSSQGIELALG
jgi:hypothetical protein